MQVLILADAPGALIELCGITLLERLLRTLQRAGVRSATVRSRTPEIIAPELEKNSPPRSEIAVRLEPAAAANVGDELRLVLPGDAVWDERLLRLLLAQAEPCVLVDAGRATGAFVTRGDEMVATARVLDIAEQPAYSLELRRAVRPLWIPAPEPARRKDAERRILDAAQKGSLDLPAVVFEVQYDLRRGMQ